MKKKYQSNEKKLSELEMQQPDASRLFFLGQIWAFLLIADELPLYPAFLS